MIVRERLYSRDPEMELVRTIPMYPTLCVSIEFSDDYDSVFERCWSAIRGFVKKSILSGSFIALSEMAAAISEKCNMSKYKAHTICEVIIASMDSYRRNFAKGSTPIATERVTVEGNVKYQFNVAVNSYFAWVEKNYKRILQDAKDGELYLVNDNATSTKEAGVVLGVLEAMDVLSFKMIGGANSQLYIYINQIQSLKNIINNPYSYKNRLLDSVSERHKVSVQMLSFLYESDFSSDEMWNILEDYFLGVIPERVKRECLKENPDMLFD